MAEKGKLSSIFDLVDRLSTREKVLVGGLIAAFFLTIAAVLWVIVSKQVQTLEQRNQTVRDALATTMQHKDTYLREKARLEAKKELLDNNTVRLVKVMEDQAKRLGFTIEDFKESKRPLTENHRRVKPRSGDAPVEKKKVTDLYEVSQTVTIRRISLEQLTRFLQGLEGRREPVKVTRMNVNTLSSDRQVLREIRMTVSTYRNEEVQP